MARKKETADAAVKTKSKNKSDAAVKADKKNVKNGSKVAAGSKSAKCKTKNKSARCLAWEETEKLTLLEGWSSDGLSMEQIAHNMGISKQTLYEWMKLSTYISDAIKKGKEVSDYMVQNALFTNALSGNVVAQIFWLKNRCPDKWQDKVEQKVEAEVDNAGGVLMIAPRLEDNDG